MSLRKTKIVATLGPATSDPAMLEQLIVAGMDVARLNFSHGSAKSHRENCEQIRKLANRHRRYVAVMADLQGPKIRIGRFRDGRIELRNNEEFVLSADYDTNEGTQEIVGIDYPSLAADCQPGDELLLDDGRIVLRVRHTDGNAVHTTVLQGGPLSDNKGINRRGGGLSADSLTDKDRADILTAAQLGVDYLAISFVRHAGDLDRARALAREAGSQAWIIAKIERAEAVADDSTLDAIIRASDGVMVARGDLAVEVGNARLVGIQKRIIRHARKLNKVVITATQMMESMTDSPIPTRAEVSDVANAALDQTDAVMLSGETAVGKYPVQAVAAMARICTGAEHEPTDPVYSPAEIEASYPHARPDETIALASMYAASHFRRISAIVCLSESGRTPLVMSRTAIQVPVYCLTRHQSTRNRAALFRGVYPVAHEVNDTDPARVEEAALSALLEQKLLAPGAWVVLTHGSLEPARRADGTNTLKLVQVPAEPLKPEPV